MTNIVEQLIGFACGIGVGKLLWTAWVPFRNRFLLMSKEDKKKLKELKKEKKQLQEELKEIKQYYDEYQSEFEKLPLFLVQTEYVETYEMFANNEPGLTKLDVIKLECSGKVLIKRMNLSEKITPKELYEIICKKFEEDGE